MTAAVRAGETADPSPFPPISDYAFLSDSHSLALVASDASIEWAVFHRFDGRPVFARILDRDKGGYFRLAPTEPQATIERRYLPGTNVLETTFKTSTGTATLIDFIPVEERGNSVGQAHRPTDSHSLVRVVRGVEGTVELRVEFKPRFAWGLTTPYARYLEDDLVLATGGAEALLLQSQMGPLELDDSGGADAIDTVAAGETKVASITWSVPAELDTGRLDPGLALEWLDSTVRFWRTWSEHNAYEGPYREAVERSALAIKGLMDDRTGAVIAAATTSLPEVIGGGRNWDYRYTWIRDSTTMLSSLVSLGYRYEARRFAEWIRNTTAGRADELQIMYGIGGERVLTETELGHLSGNQGSVPVRIGNGAWDQIQLDTYGWLASAAAFMFNHVREIGEVLDPHFVRFQKDIVELAISHFDDIDEGIWEVRGGRQHFLFSKLLMWLAVDTCSALIVAAEGPDAVPDHWAPAAAEMRRRIETEGIDPATGVFTQAFGSTALDASALQVPLVGFLPATDPRVLATIDAIDEGLGVNGHIYRYLADDGLEGEEGAFIFCTLWLVSALARSGQVERAKERFELVLSQRNDLGLLAEEIDPRTGEQLGNFPQAFSHVGIISAALAIAEAEGSTSA